MTYLILVRPKMNFPNAMPNPPIGLGYLAAILREEGHQVDIIDCAIRKETYSEIAIEINQMKPDVIGITALSSYYGEMRNLSKILQGLKIPLILGGVHVSALPELSLKECNAELAVIGEAELTLLDLMNDWEDLDKRKTVNGIVYLENNHVKINPKRELIKKLDEIPFPAWDLISPLKYPRIPHGRTAKRYPVAPILTTRGCPYSCSYCASTNFWGNSFRRRSPENVVDEMEYLINTFGIREIHIWDDNFTLIKKHVVGICREIARRKLDLTFACPNGVRIDSLDREILTIMKKVGFYSLIFAIESGSQSILDKANKKIELKKIPQIVKLCKDLGFFIPTYFIFGLPGETYTTARRSIQFAKKLPLDAITCFVAKPLPGSKLFDEWVQKQNTSDIKYDWFHFYVAENQLELTDGNRKVILPNDAYHEFYFRPQQIFRTLKFYLKTVHKEQILSFIRRFFEIFS